MKRPEKQYKFIIYTPSFDENSWWIIALHYLCHLINQLWYKAYIYKFVKYPKIRFDSLISFFRSIIYYIYYPIKVYIHTFKTYKYFNTPKYRSTIDEDCIVIYPEVIAWNPLRAHNVIRWFLNKPWVITQEILFGDNELYFFYQEVFNDKNINSNWLNLLRIMYTFNHIYKQTNFNKRSGSCYILRKWKDRTIVHNLDNSVLIDGKNHDEIAKIFNQVELCISYDLYTFYSYYATLCGCKSLVIPKDWINKITWQPDENLRIGLAYWFEELDNLDISRDQSNLHEYFKWEEMKSLNQVQEFIFKSHTFFNNSSQNA